MAGKRAEFEEKWIVCNMSQCLYDFRKKECDSCHIKLDEYIIYLESDYKNYIHKDKITTWIDKSIDKHYEVGLDLIYARDNFKKKVLADLKSLIGVKE